MGGPLQSGNLACQLTFSVSSSKAAGEAGEGQGSAAGRGGGLAWRQLTKNRKKGWGSSCNYRAFIINQMKLLEAAGVMCVVILHASPNTHTRTYMPHTGSLSLAAFFFSSEGQMALYLSVSVYQCVSVFVFVLACPLCYCLCQATCRSSARCLPVFRLPLFGPWCVGICHHQPACLSNTLF